MEITIEKIIYPGKSLGRHQGKTILTDEGIPGETVAVEIIKEKKTYCEARTKTVITSSPHRAQPRCAHYQACSPYQYIQYPLQLEIKAGQLQEILSRALKTPLPQIPIQPSPLPWGYRNKVELQIIWEQKKASYAYHQPGDRHRLIPIQECALLPDETNHLLSTLLPLLESCGRTNATAITLRTSAAEKNHTATVYCNTFKNMETLCNSRPVLEKTHAVKNLILVDVRTNAAKHLWGDETLEEKVLDATLSYGPCSFFQVNIPALTLLLKDWQHQFKDTKTGVIDFYGGVGTLGLALTKADTELLVVESEKYNQHYLTQNIQRNKRSNAHVALCDCEEWTPTIKAQTVIVDPPRKGLGPKITEKILIQKPELIYYLSCNPATLARDIVSLSGTYRLEKLCGYDFFPHTPHIETFCLLKRK